MYGIFTNIYPKNQPNVGKYTIHGAYGRDIELVDGVKLKRTNTPRRIGSFAWSMIAMSWKKVCDSMVGDCHNQ